MNKEVFYNIGKQNISNGLKDFEISSSQDYFILLSAPTGANIRIKLNSVTAHEIPIKENWSFESKDVNKIFISCDAILYGEIIYGQADGNLILKPNPTINKIDSITNIRRLEYPYDFISLDTSSIDTTSEAILFDFIIVNDYIELLITPRLGNTPSYSEIQVLIDSVPMYFGTSIGGGVYGVQRAELKELKGHRVTIKCINGGMANIVRFNYKEIN